MKKLKGFNQSINTFHDSKKQLGNTLVPVIISLAISAIASVAFLKKGGDLSAEAKILEAQYEIADSLQTWNGIKKMNPIPLLQPKENVFGSALVILGQSEGYYTLSYNTNMDREACLALAERFSSDMAGISNRYIVGQTKNPVCGLINGMYMVVIRLSA
jgi:hypothetical protein